MSPLGRLFDDSVNAVIVGGTPLALFYLRAPILADLNELRPVLGCTRGKLEQLLARS